MKTVKHRNIRRLALCGILCAAALTVFVIEAQIPLPLPIPGLKLGLANTITLFSLLYLTPRETFSILLCRILLGAVFTGSPTTLLYSLTGGLVCLAAELLIIKLLGSRFIIETSICGAIVHNTVQLICAAAVTGSAAVFFYMPPLLIAAIITGAFCGLCIAAADKHLGNRIRSVI